MVTVDLSKKVSTPQEKFLKNGKNKTMLISFLRDNLREYGFSILKLRQMPTFSLLKWLYKKPEMDQMLFMLTK